MSYAQTSTPATDILDHNPVLYSKLEAALNLSRDHAPAAMTEVVRFLDLIHASGQRLTPSLRVDLAWHELILCTRFYADFCQQRYGRFIHHQPGGDKEENNKQFAATLHHYRERFGEPPAFWWGPVQEATCGNCEAM